MIRQVVIKLLPVSATGADGALSVHDRHEPGGEVMLMVKLKLAAVRFVPAVSLVVTVVAAAAGKKW